jgi:hypothetical protein
MAGLSSHHDGSVECISYDMTQARSAADKCYLKLESLLDSKLQVTGNGDSKLELKTLKLKPELLPTHSADEC